MTRVFISELAVDHLKQTQISEVKALARASASLCDCDRQALNNVALRAFGYALDDLAFIQSDKVKMTGNQLAQQLGLGIKTLNELLSERGYLTRNKNLWKLTTKGMKHATYNKHGGRDIRWLPSIVKDLGLHD